MQTEKESRYTLNLEIKRLEEQAILLSLSIVQ